MKICEICGKPTINNKCYWGEKDPEVLQLQLEVEQAIMDASFRSRLRILQHLKEVFPKHKRGRPRKILRKA